jgi:electron transport complex protein RnfC
MIRQFLSFFGGIHPDYQKDLSATSQVAIPPLPKRVVVPLIQHIGMPCEPLVKVGDTVLTGQVIGDADGLMKARVHATLSGTVTGIGMFPHPSGREVKGVVIESDGEDNWVALDDCPDYQNLSLDAFRQRITDAGIVGLGGATFPSQVKLAPPPEHQIGTLVINGVECEPYLTADHRLMLEHADKVIAGVWIIAKILGVTEVVIGIEDNKPDAVAAIEAALAENNSFGLEVSVTVGVLPTKYPQGGEKQLIAVLTGREVPSGGLPMDVGVVVHNVGTAAAIFDAVRYGKPLVERIVTVTGEGVKNPGNVRVRLGTPARQLVEAAGCDHDQVGKVVFGGPMMGVAQYNLDVPVVKGTSGILVIPRDDLEMGDIRPCIRCSACIEVCPIGLLPNMISVCAERGAFSESEQFHPFDCIECGCCSYVCPSYRPLVQMIRFAKTEVRTLKQKAHH